MFVSAYKSRPSVCAESREILVHKLSEVFFGRRSDPFRCLATADITRHKHVAVNDVKACSRGMNP